MTKSKKKKTAKTASSKKGQHKYCRGCGSCQMIDGKCKICGSLRTEPQNTAGPETEKPAETTAPKAAETQSE